MAKQDSEKKVPTALQTGRRTFLKGISALGGIVAGASTVGGMGFLSPAEAATIEGEGAYVLQHPENQLYSVCQQCNTNCGIKVKISQGRIAKLEGNPFNPWNMTPQIPYGTSMKDAALVEGALCPKGYAGIQTLYDPYRIQKVLKRAGKRGENKWKAIPFEQAVAEIVEGGDLFGEGKVEGLKDVITLRDPALSTALAKDATAVVAKKMTLEEFKTKNAEHLHHLIDPEHPDLGPKNNQVCYNWGRLKGGRSDFINRLFKDNIGSVNLHGHTTVCQGSLYFTCKAMSDQFVEGKFTGGSKFYWQADTNNAEFILFVGANPFEANYGPPLRAGKLSQNITNGEQRIAVVDPRFSKTASRAWKWIPVEPNGVAALGMGMIRWILETERFDARYLANVTKGAAKADNEPTWSQAAWLVKLRDDGSPGAFLRGSDIGIPVEKREKKDGTWDFDAFITMSRSTPQPFDPNDEKADINGDLFVDTTIQNQRVKSVLQIYKEAALAKSLAEWAKQAGCSEEDIAILAREFTSHGKKAVADLHRGVSQHTSGFYNVVVWMMVNILIGNHDWMGGLSKATTYDTSGGKAGGPFKTGDGKKLKPWGISVIRHGVTYEKTTLFKGYPAKRVWYPFCSDIYQEIIPSAGDMYPYQIKCLFTYMAAPTYSLPSGHSLIPILADPKKIPLIVCSDITIGETSLYADYIFPDTTYLERWEFSGSHPSQVCKVAPFRQPVVTPLVDTVTVYGEKMPITLESMLLAIAEKMKFPGFGENAFGPGLHLKRDEDLYLRMVANIAFGEKADGSDKVPAASAEEIELFKKARRHLPDIVFNAERWEKVISSELWPHAVYVMNRGGRFQEYSKAYKDDQLANKYGKMINIYFDNLARATHSMTGKPYLPHGNVIDSPVDCLGNKMDDRDKGYDMTLITYKSVLQTKSRTIGNYWLDAISPENHVEIASADAERLKLADGDLVKIVSASNPEGVWDFSNGKKRSMVGKVKVLQGLRPGVVAFALGYGHWANGAGDAVINGVALPGDPRRAAGIHANAAMRTDPILKNTCLVDTVGGSAVFYQTPVKLIKI
jgi:anaerobic selenocysteine-containing dehydrogenase